MNWVIGEQVKFDDKARWVVVKAHIRLNATGEVRVDDTKEVLYDGDDNPSIFIWKDGNFSCDCNRRLFFRRAAGEDDGDDVVCTDGLYSVNLVNPSNDEVYYREFEETDSV